MSTIDREHIISSRSEITGTTFPLSPSTTHLFISRHIIYASITPPLPRTNMSNKKRHVLSCRLVGV